MGTRVGLNYQSAEFLFKIYKVKNPRKRMNELREIELGVLIEDHRQASEKEKDTGGT